MILIKIHKYCLDEAIRNKWIDSLTWRKYIYFFWKCYEYQ